MTNKWGHMLKIDHIKIRSAPHKHGVRAKFHCLIKENWPADDYRAGTEGRKMKKTRHIISKINSKRNYI